MAPQSTKRDFKQRLPADQQPVADGELGKIDASGHEVLAKHSIVEFRHHPAHLVDALASQ